MKYIMLIPLAFSLALASAAGHAADAKASPTPKATAAQTQWAAWGGSVVLRWSQYLQDEGAVIGTPERSLPLDSPRLTDNGIGLRQAAVGDLFSMRRSGSIQFRTHQHQFDGFTGGSLQVEGGYLITLPNDAGTIDLTDFRLQPSPLNPMFLDVVSQDGKAWFYIDRLMYEIVGQGHVLAIYTADMRISWQLAERLGAPHMAHQPVADLEILTDLLVADGPNSALQPAADPVPSHWHGDSVPGQPAGTVYQADLFMQSMSLSRMRQDGATGPDGNGRVVFAPSSTLRNNRNNGSSGVTVPNQGALGTSAALWGADIPWRQKFSGNLAPHGNDQHPYLIWNLYRINANGRVEQIARSGVKHAWLTTNGGCEPGEYHDGHILGRGCSDTYSSGNNDANGDLSFRSEIVPARGLWGRCGSIFDPGCVGSNTNPQPANDGYVRRMVVHEPQISATKNPGATYLFDSWYIARDDINIYNSQASVVATPTWSGSAWNLGYSDFKLGSVTDRWVSESVPAGTQVANVELDTPEGRAKLAVRATDLGNGTWRYDYALHNLDFSRAVMQGSEPNLRVLSSTGFDRFSLPVPSDATITDLWFSDGDLDAGNDWIASSAGDQISWTAPAGATLDWGTLYAFSITANRPPVASISELRVAESGSPAGYTLQTLAPIAGTIPDPVASLTPASISLSANAGSSASAALTLGNGGGPGSTLDYLVTTAPASCASPGAVAWLDATPASGSVSSGGSTQITVTADAALLAAGSYGARLCVDSSDPVNPAFEVPVSLTVNPVESYSVGGAASGTSGSGLSLRLNGGAALAVPTDGVFTFPTPLANGTPYAVTLNSAPGGQTCSIAHGSGTIAGANVTNVAVNCADIPPQSYSIGGRIRGMTAGTLVLQLNGNLTLSRSSNGLYAFAPGLPSGDAYAVTVHTQPSGQACTVSNPNGIVGAANVTNVDVDCAAVAEAIFSNGFESAPLR